MPRMHTMAKVLDDAASVWFGEALPPAIRAMEESGWGADEPEAYCHRCGGSVGAGEAIEKGCAGCKGKSALADRVVRLGRYEGVLREWVLDIKYRSQWVEMGELLGQRLGIAVKTAGIGCIQARDTVVVPMPGPWQRVIHRGIDHAGIIGRAVGRELGASVSFRLGRRNGPPQSSLSRTERMRRGGRGLRLKRRYLARRLEGRTVVLVDDVTTTGATLKAAGRLLRGLGPARIWVAVLAVTDEASRRAVLKGGSVGGDKKCVNSA